MTKQERFDRWLADCPVEYMEVFGRNTYRFVIREEDEPVEEVAH